MVKLLSLALTVTLLVVAALPSAQAYTAMHWKSTTWALASTAGEQQQKCGPAPQVCTGPMCGYPQPMPCPPQRISKCKPVCPPTGPCAAPAMPCGPMPCYGAPTCGPAPCPPPCNPRSGWDTLITNLWY